MNQNKPEAISSGRENFVSRLYQMLATPRFAGIVSWNKTDQGPSFVIFDTAKFQDQVLVSEFNHANFSSFVRQLNKYDFHKVKFRDSHSRIWEFRHPNFRPENSDKTYLIKRKQQSNTRRSRRLDNSLKEQADVAAKAAEYVANSAEEIVHTQFNDLESRVQRLEENNVQFLRALKMQQNLVERLLRVVNLPDDDPEDFHRANIQINNMNNQVNSVNTNVAANDPVAIRNVPFNSTGMIQSQSNSSSILSNSIHNNNHQGGMMNSPGNSLSVENQNQVRPSNEYGTAFSPTTITVNTLESSSPLILIAVNDIKVRDALTKLLHSMGCRIEAVESGVDVVQRVETQNFDFILIDCILKGLDGVSAVELIRQSNSFTPVILMSDRISDDERDSYLSRGVSTVLYRPFSQAELYKVLQDCKSTPPLM